MQPCWIFQVSEVEINDVWNTFAISVPISVAFCCHCCDLLWPWAELGSPDQLRLAPLLQDEVHCELSARPTHAALEVLAKLAVLTVHHWLCMAALSADSAYITELPLGFKCLEGSFRNSRRKETLLVYACVTFWACIVKSHGWLDWTSHEWYQKMLWHL